MEILDLISHLVKMAVSETLIKLEIVHISDLLHIEGTIYRIHEWRRLTSISQSQRKT